MQFYLPQPGQNSTYDFGTCLHSVEQYLTRDKKHNGASECLHKFRFDENTGYSFVVGDKSYQSVNTVDADQKYHRNTILVNWYRDVGGTP